MKKLFLSLLLVVGTLSAQEPSFYVDEAIIPYVNNFIEVIQDDGWNLEDFKEKEFIVVFDRFLEQRLEVAGLAMGMDNDDTVQVVINLGAWVTLEDYEKQDLINHELMHDMYNVKHTEDDDEDRLMHPSSYPKNWGDTMSRLFRAINDLNEANGY